MRSPKRFVATLLIALALVSLSAAQNQQSPPSSQTDQNGEASLGEVARQSKKTKDLNKKLPVREDLDPAGPFPKLNMEGVDNSAEITRAIADYVPGHSKDETESAVRTWYDEYDAMLATAIHENIETRDRRESTNFTGSQLCMESQDYAACAARQRAEARGARADNFNMRDNGLLIARIQQAFMKIRTGICRSGLRYDWFQIRNANGNGSY
jgi:hypothetical protein